jgi:hypothetical protein
LLHLTPGFSELLAIPGDKNNGFKVLRKAKGGGFSDP